MLCKNMFDFVAPRFDQRRFHGRGAADYAVSDIDAIHPHKGKFDVMTLHCRTMGSLMS
jgi:hypothetical protein